jgi:hypothetical protein
MLVSARKAVNVGGTLAPGNALTGPHQSARTDGQTSSYEFQSAVVTPSTYIAGMDSDPQRDPQTDSESGQCGLCQHVRIIRNGRSDFFLCERSVDDDQYPRYPRLPMVGCGGYKQGH